MFCLSPISSNCNSLINSICSMRDDVVELIGHPSWAGHICHTAWSIQLWCQDIVKHPACVTDLKAAWLYTANLKHTSVLDLISIIKPILCIKKMTSEHVFSQASWDLCQCWFSCINTCNIKLYKYLYMWNTHSCRSNDSDTLLIGCFDEFAGQSFRNAFSYDSYSVYLIIQEEIRNQETRVIPTVEATGTEYQPLAWKGKYIQWDDIILTTVQDNIVLYQSKVWGKSVSYGFQHSPYIIRYIIWDYRHCSQEHRLRFFF